MSSFISFEICRYFWYHYLNEDKEPICLSKESESEVAQSCPTLCDPVDCSLPGSSFHGILQARILEWVAISCSRGSSRPRDWTWVSRIVGRHFNLWATREVSSCLKEPKFKGKKSTVLLTMKWTCKNHPFWSRNERLQKGMKIRRAIRQKSNTIGVYGFMIYKVSLELFVFTAQWGGCSYIHFTDKTAETWNCICFVPKAPR